MSCNRNKKKCGCDFNIKSFGLCDVSRIKLDGKDRTKLNWNEISIPEIFEVPEQKPDIEHLDQVYVNAKIDCVKLIETPYSYKSYERLATAFEISTVTAAINLADIDLTPIITAVEAILAIPGLPAIPLVAALQAALVGVTTAGTNLAAAVADALAALAEPCIAASLLTILVDSVIAALEVLKVAINVLIAAANALAAATAAIPIVGPLVATAVAALITAINAVIVLIDTAITALLASITLIGETNVLVIQSNAEGTCLSGRKLIIEGVLEQKIVYTGLVLSQTVHSACKNIPFSAYIIPYANFTGLTYVENQVVIADPAVPCETITVNGFLYNPAEPITVDLCEEFSVNSCVEDIFAYPINTRTVFKNITLFLSAKPIKSCQ